MGKTVESFRMALEGEINRWSGFAYALRKPDREAFDELIDMCRTFATESSNATNPIIFEPMVMSILLAQQKRIMQLEKELQGIKPNSTIASEIVTSNTKQLQTDQNSQAVSSGGEQRRLN